MAGTFGLGWPGSEDLIEEMVNKLSSTFHPDAASLMFYNMCLFIYLFPPLFPVRPPQPRLELCGLGIVNTNPTLHKQSSDFWPANEGLAR